MTHENGTPSGLSLLNLSLEEKFDSCCESIVNSENFCLTQKAPGIFEFCPRNIETRSSTHHLTKVILSCGIHGNETAPIEICESLSQAIINESIPCCRPLLLIFGNIDAIKANRRFTTENLNRLFTKKPPKDSSAKNSETKRAQVIMAAVDEFANNANRVIHYDLHTAIRDSQFPLFTVEPVSELSQDNTFHYQLFDKLGIEANLKNHLPTHTFSRYTHTYFGAEAFTLELGKVKPFGSNPVETQQKALMQFSHLLSEMALILDSERDVSLSSFKIIHELTKRSENFKLHLDPKLPNFSNLPPGICVAEDDNYTYIPQSDDEYIVFPNPNVAVGQRAGLIVSPN